MKNKYKTLFKYRYKGYNVKIKKNNSEYIFMYCKKSIIDFDRKAKRIKHRSFLSLIKTALRMYLGIQNYSGRRLF